jgi:hypothetical protein
MSDLTNYDFFLFLPGYNPHCILFMGSATNGSRRSRGRWYLSNVETKRDAAARHTSSHLVFHFLPFVGICIIEPLLTIYGFHSLRLIFFLYPADTPFLKLSLFFTDDEIKKIS